MNMSTVSEKIEFPPGVFFSPTDKQVIDFFLKPKVLGHDLLFDVVKNKQVYGPGPHSNPWQVFDPNDHGSWFDCADKETEKMMLVFTKLSKIANDSNKKKKKNCNARVARKRDNTSRIAGCGTWSAKTKPEEIKNCDGNVIGEKRYFVFEIKDIDAAVGKSLGSYRMHEYCLSGIYERFDLDRTLVLCKITYESSKNLVGPEITTNHVLSSNSGEPGQLKEERYTNLEGTSTSTLTVMDPEGSTTVGDDPALAQVDIVNEVGQDFCFGDQGGDLSVEDYLCLDEDWISEILNSLPEGDLFQDTTIANLGKRKFEAESLCGTKKLCLG